LRIFCEASLGFFFNLRIFASSTRQPTQGGCGGGRRVRHAPRSAEALFQVCSDFFCTFSVRRPWGFFNFKDFSVVKSSTNAGGTASPPRFGDCKSFVASFQGLFCAFSVRPRWDFFFNSRIFAVSTRQLTQGRRGRGRRVRHAPGSAEALFQVCSGFFCTFSVRRPWDFFSI